MAAPEPDPSPSTPEAEPSSETPAVRPAPPTATPALRASDADRERTATVLRDAGGDGRLTVQELDERLDAAYAAVTHDDLDGLVTDLVPAGAHRTATPAPAGRVAVRGGDGGSRWLVAIMSGVERAGVWRLGRRCTSLSLMGGSELDLTHVEFDDQDAHLRVICVMGGAEIRVPEHMNVVVSDFGFMGGNNVRVGHAQPDPGGPTLHLHLVSVMGGSNVERGPKRSRRERKELERRERDRLDGGR